MKDEKCFGEQDRQGEAVAGETRELTLERFEEAFEQVSRVTQETKLVYSEYFSAACGTRCI